MPTPGDKRHMEMRGNPADLVSFTFLSILCSSLSVSLPLDQTVGDKNPDTHILTGQVIAWRPQGYSIQGNKWEKHTGQLI